MISDKRQVDVRYCSALPLVVAVALLLATPLIFVQSRVGFIEYEADGKSTFSALGPGEQYVYALRRLVPFVLSLAGGGVIFADGESLPRPKNPTAAEGLGYAIGVILLIAGFLWLLFVKQLRDNSRAVGQLRDQRDAKVTNWGPSWLRRTEPH